MSHLYKQMHPLSMTRFPRFFFSVRAQTEVPSAVLFFQREFFLCHSLSVWLNCPLTPSAQSRDTTRRSGVPESLPPPTAIAFAFRNPYFSAIVSALSNKFSELSSLSSIWEYNDFLQQVIYRFHVPASWRFSGKPSQCVPFRLSS